MFRTAFALAVATGFASATGCGSSSPTTPATDPDTIRKLEAEQKQAAQGEGGDEKQRRAKD